MLAIVGVQSVNYWPLNEGWRITHDEGLTRDRMAKAQLQRDRRIPLQAEPHDLTKDEVRAIWLAWKQDRLDRYLREHRVSAAAVYAVVELQELDRARQRRAVTRRPDAGWTGTAWAAGSRAWRRRGRRRAWRRRWACC